MRLKLSKAKLFAYNTVVFRQKTFRMTGNWCMISGLFFSISLFRAFKWIQSGWSPDHLSSIVWRKGQTPAWGIRSHIFLKEYWANHLPPRLISTKKSPRAPALQRKWEVWDVSADKAAGLSACVYSAARSLGFPRSLPGLLLSAAWDKPLKRKLFSFFPPFTRVWSHSLPVWVFYPLFGLCINSVAGEFIFPALRSKFLWQLNLCPCKNLSRRVEVVQATEAKIWNVLGLCVERRGQSKQRFSK